MKFIEQVSFLGTRRFRSCYSNANRKQLKNFRIFIAAIITLLPFSIANAGNYYWNDSSGFLQQPWKWSTCPPGSCPSAVVPGINDDVYFELVNGTIIFTLNPTNRDAYVSGTTTAFNLNTGYALTGSLSVGQDSSYNSDTLSTLNLENGSLSAPDVRVGTESGYTGRMNLSNNAFLSSDDASIATESGSTGV